MIEFFENLKQKRIENSIELKIISEKTLLNINILNSIENGEIDKLPKGYRRIYLRRYIKEIGLNPDEIMKDYNLLIGDTDVETIRETAVQQQKDKASRWQFNYSKDKIIHYLSTSMIVLAVGVTILVIYLATKYLNENENYKIKEISVESMVELKDSLVEEDSKVDTLLPVVLENPNKEPEYFSFIVSVNSRCWIREIVDFIDTTEYVLKRNNRKKISAKKSVRLIAGNGHAIKIVQNGKNLENKAPKGSIIRSLIIDKNGIVKNSYYMPKKKEQEKVDSTNTTTTTENLDA